MCPFRIRVALLLLICISQGNESLGKSLPNDDKEITTRATRFPSIEERVKLYMSNWYAPSCQNYKDGLVRYKYSKDKKWPKLTVKSLQNHPMVNATDSYQIQSIVEPDQLFYMDPEIIVQCANRTFDEETETNQRQLELAKRVKFRLNMRMYCHDVKESLLAALFHVQWETRTESSSPPTLLQFGDNKNSHIFGNVMLPHIKKFRSAAISPQELSKVTSPECYSSPRDLLETLHGNDKLQPIVWKLATHRHYEKLYQVYREDTHGIRRKIWQCFEGN